ncbi:MAG: PQQ-dependent sugar dehydrogenase [Planctomycetes bacterium]|nr:PQQ-dependent sugar dehydrogenase [Planctomycetota bacterium]
MNANLIVSMLLAVLLQQAEPPTSPLPNANKGPIPRIRVSRLFPSLQLRRPVQALQAPGDARSLFVLEQAGRIVRLDLQDASVTEAPTWMDIREQVHDRGNEEGLLSLAFHPKFAENGQFFVYYSATSPRRSELTRFTVDRTSGKPDIRSAKVLLEIPQPYSNHNGGTVLFGPDGMLYLSIGDGGAANDPHNHSQNPSTLLGTVIRIDVDRAVDGKPYAIPADNPFVGNAKAAPEVWAYGLRNVWRMSFDRGSRKLYGGDVGQNAWEEIDIIQRGGNYGWNVREGRHAFAPARPGALNTDYVEPVAEYGHGEGVSVTGGFVYRGARFPTLQGVYLYADYAFGTIWGLRCGDGGCGEPVVVWKRGAATQMWSSFGELHDGELVLCAFDGGESGPGSLWKIDDVEGN